MTTGRSVPDAALLAGVGLFAGLPAAALEHLARVAGTVRVQAGELLFDQGDPGASLYAVRSGRLEVLVDGEVVRVHGRGEAFGELALLSGGVRTAAVRARRDSELLVVERAEFDRLLAAEPAFSRALVDVLGLRLRRGDVAPAPLPTATVLAFVAVQPELPAGLVARLADGLLTALRVHSRAVRLDAGPDPAGWAGQLDTAERGHELVLLVAVEPAGTWSRFCLRQADRVLAVVDPAGAGPAVLPPGSQLVALGAAGLDRWLDSAGPGAHHLVDPAAPAADLARLGRRIAGRSLGLVLSGGGARGLAHLGVIDVLRGAGVRIDRVGGTSMGAFVAGLLAHGSGTAEMLTVARRELVQRRPFSDYTVPRHGLLRAVRAGAMLDRVFGDRRLEHARCAPFTVSVDLVAAEEVVHRRGRVADAVGLSMRLPGVAPPMWVGQRLHVDGGVLDNLPIAVMAADGEGPVVAVDVMRPFAVPPGAPSSRPLPGIVDTIGRSMVLASWQRAEAARRLARAVIVPALADVGMFDFGRLDEIVEIGRGAARRALPGLDDLLDGRVNDRAEQDDPWG